MEHHMTDIVPYTVVQSNGKMNIGNTCMQY
jgi:hypothetical protein